MFKYELRCEICSSKFDSNYNIPKVLICGHTVCSKCVDRMKEKNIYRCPFDRKVIDFDEDKIANNYYILSLIDGSIKENPNTCEEEVEEIFELNPKPVINNPGWKNTLDGFIKGDVLYTIESNGFFYCTDLNTGEWWFLYLNQFWGKNFFQTPLGKMFMIDQYGNLFQIFKKNYYIQIGKKNAWKNTTHLCTLNNKLYSIETSNKFYETNLDNGKWREIGARKDFTSDEEENVNLIDDGDMEEPIISNHDNFETQNTDDQNQISSSINLENVIQPNDLISDSLNIPESNNGMLDINMGGYNIRIPNIFRPYALNISNTLNNLNKQENFVYRKKSNAEPFFDIKNSTLLVSTGKNLLVANKLGELFLLNEITGDSTLIRSDFCKNIESYSSNNSHVYYFEKGGNMIYRNYFGKEDLNNFYNKNISPPSELNYQICNNMNLVQSSNEIITTPSLISENLNKTESIKKLEYDEKSKKRFNSSNATNSSNLISLNIQSQKNTSDNIFTSNTGNFISQKLLETEIFLELDVDTNPVKIFADDNKVVITDKKGELLIYDVESKSEKKFQCLFMLRNCHLHNTILVGDGDLVIIDPIRLSLNKLNILTGSEVIILHSLKFLSTIKYIFSCNSKIYFVDVAGSLFHFIESEKKIAQVGNNGLCKYILDFAVHKNCLFTIENITLYKTNLADGNFIEIKNEYSINYKFFFGDNVYLIFINKEDEIILVKPEETLKFVKKIYHKNISKVQSITYFKSHIIYYDQVTRNIVGVNLEKEKEMKIERKENEIKCEECKSETIQDSEMILDQSESSCKILAKNFPDVSLFVNNHDCLACILKDGIIYKLFC